MVPRMWVCVRTLKHMSFTASILRVVIASPSDIPEARDAVERALHNWNDANSISKTYCSSSLALGDSFRATSRRAPAVAD